MVPSFGNFADAVSVTGLRFSGLGALSWKLVWFGASVSLIASDGFHPEGAEMVGITFGV